MKHCILLLAFAALAFAADLTGTWAFAVESEMGSGTPTFTFKQDGDKLTGTYRGQLGEAPISGKIQGDKFDFSFDIAPSGEKLTVKYAGTMEGGNQMKGTVDFGGQAKGSFTAKKQQ